MTDENCGYGLSENSRYMLKAANRIAIGIIIALWGSLLVMKHFGILGKEVSTWPLPLIAFGILLIAGGIYRLHARRKLDNLEQHFNVKKED